MPATNEELKLEELLKRDQCRSYDRVHLQLEIIRKKVMLWI